MLPPDTVIAVVHSDVPDNCPKDEQDIIITANDVNGWLKKRNLKAVNIPYSNDFNILSRRISDISPDIIFNLIDDFSGLGVSLEQATADLEKTGLPVTGCSAAATGLTTDKIKAKEVMVRNGIKTPGCLSESDIAALSELDGTYILKSINIDASVGLFSENVTDDIKKLRKILAERKKTYGGEWFAEQYIDGREFNISVFETADGDVEVLPFAEIRFIDFPADLPKIVDYDAKWTEDSEKYEKTVRSFDFSDNDNDLLNRLREISVRCWNVFGLTGYARVDYRVAADGTPYVLEINPNPGIAADAGFIAAAEKNGLSPDMTVTIIAKNARVTVKDK